MQHRTLTSHETCAPRNAEGRPADTFNSRIRVQRGTTLRFERVDSLGQTGNLTSGFLPVNDPLARDLVQRGRGIGQGLLSAFLVVIQNGGAHLFDHVLHAGTGGTVAGVTLDADEIIKKRGGRAPVVIPVLLKQ